MEFKIGKNNDLIYTGENEDKKENYVSFTLSQAKVMQIRMVYVDEKYRGMGVASSLMKEVVKYATKNNYKIYNICSYAEKWFLNHEEHQNLLA